MVSELCPYCGCEVELRAEMKPQRCPECKMWICPCAMCECECICAGCDVEEECNRLNDKQ